MVRVIFFLVVFLIMNINCYASNNSVKMVDMVDSMYIRSALSNGDIRDYNGSRRSSNMVLMNSKNGGYAVYNLNRKYESFSGYVYLAQKFKTPIGKGIKVIITCDGTTVYSLENLTFKKKDKISLNLKNINKMEVFIVDRSNYENGLIKFRSSDLIGYNEAINRYDLHVAADVFLYKGVFRKHGHSLTGMKLVKEPDCSNSGLEQNKCRTCSEVVDSKVIPPLGHKTDEKWVKSRDATCSTLGLEVVYCTVCKQVVKERELPLLPHHYDKKGEFIIKNPSCTEDGIMGRKCSICGDVEKTAIVKVDHMIKDWKVLSGSFINNPIVKEGKCSVCNKVIKVNDNRYILIEWIIKSLPVIVVLVILSLYLYLKRKGYHFGIHR